MSSIDELMDLARTDVDSGRLPACQVAVARDGELIAFETFGDATDSTRFCVFSATKPIVASAIWLLLGEGRLELERPVADYLPEFAANGKEAVTVEQVMLHTAGFPNAVMSPAEGADPVARAARLASWSLEWEPGSRFEYHATSAHYVLAELLARIEERDFRDVIDDRVCAPLGLPRVLGLPVDQQDDIALLQVKEIGEATEWLGTLTRPDLVAAGIPGGGAIMTAADLAMFYQGVLRNTGGLWDGDVLADVTSTIRSTLLDPLFNIPVNRSAGLVIAGDDGNHYLRYAAFGFSNSPGAFGHAGAFMQVGWGDPATGISFAYCHNGLYDDMLTDGIRGVSLSDLAASLD